MSTLRYRDYDRPTHPLADFFSKQLPLMLQQHQQNKEARIHEKDMAQFRIDGQKELALLNDELAQKREMKTFELEDAQLRLSNAEQALKDADKQLQDLYGITPSMGKIGKDETTNAAGEIVNNLAEQAGRNRNFIIEDYSNSENYLESVLSNLDEIAQQQAINDEMMAGANFGARVANLITDSNKDNKLNADDIDAYFKSKDALTKELTPLQQIGFDKTFPTAQETFFTQLEQQSLIDQRNANIASKNAEAQSQIKTKDPRGIHNVFVKMYDDKVENKALDDTFLSKINTINLEAYDKDHFKGKPENLRRTTSDLVLNLYNALDHVEHKLFSGMTNDYIDKTLDAINSTTDDSVKKAKMYELVNNIFVDKAGYRRSPEAFDELVSGSKEETLAIWKRMDHFKQLYEMERVSQAYQDKGETNPLGY